MPQTTEVQKVECQCEGETIEGRTVKTSHYCPLHDKCEDCEERLGIMKDPEPTPGRRPMWLCAQCEQEINRPMVDFKPAVDGTPNAWECCWCPERDTFRAMTIHVRTVHAADIERAKEWRQ